MELVGRLLRGPDLSGVTGSAEREAILQRHISEQQGLIGELLSALGVLPREVGVVVEQGQEQEQEE
jgi:hypothetical protein